MENNYFHQLIAAPQDFKPELTLDELKELVIEKYTFHNSLIQDRLSSIKGMSSNERAFLMQLWWIIVDDWIFFKSNKKLDKVSLNNHMKHYEIYNDSDYNQIVQEQNELIGELNKFKKETKVSNSVQ